MPAVTGARPDSAWWDISETVRESWEQSGENAGHVGVRFEPGFATHCGVTLGRFLSKFEPRLPCAYVTDNEGAPPMASAGGLSEVPYGSREHTAGDVTSLSLS